RRRDGAGRAPRWPGRARRLRPGDALRVGGRAARIRARRAALVRAAARRAGLRSKENHPHAPSLALLLRWSGEGPAAPPAGHSEGNGRRPDILLILLDDVGIDQMTAFGWGGTDPASTPNIDRSAAAGVKF